jgi:Domain of unknown function (DUF3402)
VLLKLLLATVSAGNISQPPQSSTSSVFPPGVASRKSDLFDQFDNNIDDLTAQEAPPAPPPTLDEIDVTRHREITSKAVSAILLLILKWFKVSRKLKFCVQVADTLIIISFTRCHEVSSSGSNSTGYKLFIVDPEDVWTARSFSVCRFQG